MARIRTIKPEFFTSDQIVECSTSARLLFVGMWCFSDDGGVHPASPKRLKMEVFPADSFTIEEVTAWVKELLRVGLIEEFEHDGTAYWHIKGWHHQKIDRPTYLYPRSKEFGEESSRHRRTIGDNSPIPRPGVESKGVESKVKESNRIEGVDVPVGVSPKGCLDTEEFRDVWAKWIYHLCQKNGKPPTDPQLEECLMDLTRQGYEKALADVKLSLRSGAGQIWDSSRISSGKAKSKSKSTDDEERGGGQSAPVKPMDQLAGKYSSQ